MDGQALEWYVWMCTNTQLFSWKHFLHSLQTRLALSLMIPKVHCSNWHKLQQYENINVSLRHYQIVVLTNLTIFFQFVLYPIKTQIHREVQALKPINLMHTIDLSKSQKDKYPEMCKFHKTSYPNNTYLSNQHASCQAPRPANLGYPNLQIHYLQKGYHLWTSRKARKRIVLYMWWKFFINT